MAVPIRLLYLLHCFYGSGMEADSSWILTAKKQRIFSQALFLVKTGYQYEMFHRQDL